MAFDWIKIKTDEAFIEKEFKNEYFRLAEQCRSFSEGIHGPWMPDIFCHRFMDPCLQVSMLGLCWSAAEVRIILNGNSSAAQISQKQEFKSQGNRRSTLIKTSLSPRASIRNQKKEKTEKNEQLHQRIFLNDDETGSFSPSEAGIYGAPT